MRKFALRLNEFARGRVKMYNLLIDGIDQVDVFEESWKQNMNLNLNQWQQLSHK